MIDQKLLSDTLQKIHASLNKRFEKDAELYISRQDEFEIKKLLCSNAYAAVYNFSVGKDISPEIILKVIVRNAGIFNIDNIEKFESELKPIIKNVKYEAVSYLMEDVLNNTVYIDKGLKRLIFKNYMRYISYQDRITYWNADKYRLDTHERKELFLAMIQGGQDDEPDFDEKWRFIVKAIDSYRFLLHNNRLLLEFKKGLSEAESKSLFKRICEEMRNPAVDDTLYCNMIVNTYVSFGDEAFSDAIGTLKLGSPKYKLYVRAISNLLGKQEALDIVKNRFDAFYKLYRQSVLSNHIKEEMDRKVWKAAKKNQELYRERNQQIDYYMPEVEKIQYKDFSEIIGDIENDKKPKEIAFTWVNMKTDELKHSFFEAFSYTDEAYEDEMREALEWIFRHNQGRGRSHYKKICEIMAEVLVQLRKIDTPYAEIADKILLENILLYNVKGRAIPAYLSAYHFEEYKKQYIQ